MSGRRDISQPPIARDRRRVRELTYPSTQASVAGLPDFAFALDGATATREQRLSATCASHRLIRRMNEATEKASQLFDEAHREAEATVGPRPPLPKVPRTDAGWPAFVAAEKAYIAADQRHDAAFKATEAYSRAEKLRAFVNQFGSWTRTIKVDRDTFRKREFWRATLDGNGTLWRTRPTFRSESGPSQSSAPE